MALQLNDRGYFTRDGEQFVPVGVNYWPASCGVEMWARWPEAEIRADLDVVKALGLNCVRFFLRWQDFEPQPGKYDLAMFAHLGDFLHWCKEREIYAQPSLFVGWMSGGIFWPAWREGRNTFADAFMAERSAAFARKAAEVIAPFHENLLGIDQGNELCCLPDGPAAPPQAVLAWCASVNNAIRSVYPKALIVSGNEQNQVMNDTGWRLGQQPGVDYYSMHGYPVPGWNVVPFDGLTDPLAQSLLPANIAVARAFGPVLCQEFGTIVTFGKRQQDAYLRGLLPACWEAGANGFLWWCLRDIRAEVYPYLHNGFEGTLGLVNDQNQVKPGLEYFLRFAHELPNRPTPNRETLQTAIYIPDHYYPRGETTAVPNQPYLLARGQTMARYLLEKMGIASRFVRRQQLSSDLKTLIVPGALLDVTEIRALRDWTGWGGHLVWSGPDPINWGPDLVALLGAVPVDYRAGQPARVQAFGENWDIQRFPRDLRLEVEPHGAEVLARDLEGRAAVLRHASGHGRVTYSMGWVEESAALAAGSREARDRWVDFYRGLLD